MSRPIDADALKKWINDQLLLDDDDPEPLYANNIKISESKPCHDNQLIWSSDVMDAIDRAPTVEKEELMKSGEWLWDRPHHFRCSVCGRVGGVSIALYKYCPHCGSLMFLSEEERKKEWND